MTQSVIYELLLDKSKSEIQGQIAHFEKLAKEAPEEETASHYNRHSYADMLDGAKMILNIITTDPIGKEGTRNWLHNLSYSQLEYARDTAVELIKKKDDEEKVKIWCVQTTHSSVYYFKEYDDAASKLKKLISDEIKKKRSVRDAELIQISVRESELSEYIR